MYKKAYHIIALVVLVVGMGLIPFIGFFVGETTLNLNFTFVYILFLFQCVSSYLVTYKRSILYAYQKNYIISIIESLYIVVLNVLQLMILQITKNYYLYLAIKIIFALIENIVISKIADTKFPFIKEKNVKNLNENIEKDIFERIKATFLHKIGGVVIRGTDNIIISKFLGLGIVGIYSNYYMIILYVGEIIRQMISSLTPSVGNLLVEGNEESILSVHKKINFFNFWLATFSATSILVIVQSFIKIWMGTEYLLSMWVVIVLVMNYYLTIMRSTNDTFFSAAGIWIETKYVPLVESFMNIIFSLVLLKIFGLAGVFLGTLISSMALWCYTYPKFIYKKILRKTYFEYIKENGIYLLIFIAISGITYLASKIFVISNLWLDIIIRVLICLIVPNFILLIIYRKSDEFEYFKNLIKYLLKTKLTKKT